MGPWDGVDMLYTLMATNVGYPSCSPGKYTSASRLFNTLQVIPNGMPSYSPSHFERYSGVMGSSLGGASSTGCLGANEPFWCSAEPVPVIFGGSWIEMWYLLV